MYLFAACPEDLFNELKNARINRKKYLKSYAEIKIAFIPYEEQVKNYVYYAFVTTSR